MYINILYTYYIYIHMYMYMDMYVYIYIYTSYIHTYIYIYGYSNTGNPYTLVLTSVFPIVFVTVDEQSVVLLLLLTLLNIYVGYTETICRESWFHCFHWHDCDRHLFRYGYPGKVDTCRWLILKISGICAAVFTCQNIWYCTKVALNLSRRHWSARDTLSHLVQQRKRIPNLSLVCPPLIRILQRTHFTHKAHPYVRYLTLSSCSRGSGVANHLWFVSHTLSFGNLTTFCCQVKSHTLSRKYWSTSDKVCVSRSPFTSSLNNFFRCCTIDSSDADCGCFLVGIGSVESQGTDGTRLNRERRESGDRRDQT